MTFQFDSHVFDPDRVAAVHDSGLLDTPAEDAFDRLTRMTCEMVQAPAAMLSLLDSDRQFIKSECGLTDPWAGRSVPVADSLCRHVVDSGEPVVVTDARKDERVHSSPAIPELRIIAYVGLPIRVDGGYVLGSLCAIDHLPRSWVAEDVAILGVLASIAAHQLNLRIARHRANREPGDEARRAKHSPSLVEGASDMTYVMDASGIVRDASAAIQQVLGLAPEEVVGRREADFVHPDDMPRIAEAFERDIRCTVAGPPHDLRFRHRNGSWRIVEARRKLLIDDRGQLVAVVNAHDVTDRRRDEGALLVSEDGFPLSARAMNDVIWKWSIRTGLQ